jgi:F-type H+-transporting ATPase subunit delta
MSVAATRYAKALLDVLHPDRSAAGLDQLRSFADVLSREADARVVLQHPTLATEKRKAMLNKIGEALGLSEPVRNFLVLLMERDRLDLLDEVVSTYERLLDEKQGVVRAHVTSAHELDSKQQEAVVTRLQTVTGKKVRMKVSVDPALIGGIIAQVGSTIYDGSIRQQLATFRSSLAQD